VLNDETKINSDIPNNDLRKSILVFVHVILRILKKTDCEGRIWINLSSDRNQRQSLLNIIVNFWFAKELGFS
jgi:hypothetical protein